MGSRPPLRAALIGCGYISTQHIPAWQATPDAELFGAGTVGVDKVYDDVETMLASEQLDCFDIATRPETHQALARLAANKGINVLCQKPLASTLAEARAIADLCDEAGVRFMVLEMWRHLPVLRDLKHYLDQDLIGPVHMLRLLGHRRPMQRSYPVDANQPTSPRCRGYWPTR